MRQRRGIHWQIHCFGCTGGRRGWGSNGQRIAHCRLGSVAHFGWGRAARGYSPAREVHLQEFPMGRESELTILRLQTVDMDRSVRGLCGHEFIEGIPSHALHIV